ncbi:MAG: tRNA (guanosine(37)-N1)-methyltransferase TrmD [Treponema sp.]|nr:tRNA (guanosine(37)-N1)-methyltransferase TrmD [Treponema sp.]
MRYTVLTLFPEITDAFFASSIMAKAIDRGIVEYRAVNIRDFAHDRHKTCDDAPYGGGAGMLMLAEPLALALQSVGVAGKGLHSAPVGAEAGWGEAEDEACRRQDLAEAGGETSPLMVKTEDEACQRQDLAGAGRRVLYLSPSGRPLTQALAGELAACGELVLVCGRYEGIDQRVIDRYIDEELSVGDYVLSSGEVAALVVADTTYRLIDRVITPGSLAEESFAGGLLEYPQYTRPEVYDTMAVPEVLISGHHEKIRYWRLERRVAKTVRNRPDLIAEGLEAGLFDEETKALIDRQLLAEGDGEDECDREG